MYIFLDNDIKHQAQDFFKFKYFGKLEAFLEMVFRLVFRNPGGGFNNKEIIKNNVTYSGYFTKISKLESIVLNLLEYYRGGKNNRPEKP